MLLTYVGAEELGTCPAAVLMDDGTIQINADVWGRYSPFEQKFIIEHERGHYILQTSSETEADRYALGQMFGTEPRSLKQSIGTLVKMGTAIPHERVEALYREALMIDAKANNNRKAENELKLLTNNNTNMRQSKFDTYNRRRADGLTEYNGGVAPEELLYTDENPRSCDVPQSTGFIKIFTQRRPGLQIGGAFLDLQTILTMAILVVLCMIYKKK